MKKILFTVLFFLFLPGCNSIIINEPDTGLIGLNNYVRKFDFSDTKQLNDVPTFGKDYSRIENGSLKIEIAENSHKGLGRKFWFEKNGGEPNEAEMEFTIRLADNFQKDGVKNQAGKFPGFAGVYDRSAGSGGRKVTTQKSWSVRIAHFGETREGTIPIGLYVYHPGMLHRYGTTIKPGFYLNRDQTYTIELYIKMNDINKKNGILRLCVDGNEIYSSNSWRFRDYNSVHIRSAWLDVFVGGSIPSKVDTYVIIDDLKIKW